MKIKILIILSVLFFAVVDLSAQTQRSRAYLYTRFETGDKPTQTDFRDVFETFFSRFQDSLYVSQIRGIDTLSQDATLADSSSRKIVSQAAIKAYVDNAVSSGGTVSSVFGRTGAVVAASGDYTAAQVTNVPAAGIAAVNVQTAITELANEKADTSRAAGGDVSGTLSSMQIRTGVVGATELSSSGVTLGTYGNATNVPQVTVDADGRITSATNVAITLLPANGDYGDVDVTSSGAVWTVDTNAVDSVKIATGGIGNTDLANAIISWSKLGQAVKDSINAGITSYNFTDTGHGYVSGDVGKLGYLNATGFHLANSDYGAADSVAQYYLVSVTDANTIKIATAGRVAKTHAFAVGSYLYLSATPGEYTNVKPETTNAQYVGRVPADDVIDVSINDLSNAQIPESSESVVQINAQTGTTYTLIATDIGKLVTMTNASANTLTVPPNASVAFEIGSKINISQFGSGQTTISPGSGVTINSADSANKTRVVYSTASLIKTGTNTWLLAGDITI